MACTPCEGPARRFRPSGLRRPRPLAGIRAAHAGFLDLHVLLSLRALFAQPVAEHRPLEADARGVPRLVACVAEQNEPLVVAAIARHARPLVHPGKGTEACFALIELACLLLGSFGPSLRPQGHARAIATCCPRACPPRAPPARCGPCRSHGHAEACKTSEARGGHGAPSRCRPWASGSMQAMGRTDSEIQKSAGEYLSFPRSVFNI